MPLVNGRYGPKNPAWLLAGMPAGLSRENFGRMQVLADSAALTSGVMLATALPLYAGDLVSSLTFHSGSVAAASPTNWWFALFDDSATPQFLAQSVDQGSAAWAANTAVTLPMSAQQQIVRNGIYYAALMVKAATPPSILGLATLTGGVVGYTAADKLLTSNSGSTLAGTAPGTIASPAASAFVPRVLAS
ncbi:hypothetical protein [Kitasatospora sp. NBC_01266]|uniref:hypothetical protein n=1 Tax=Kitasatospora sp. NBC_01266 TaxID=2903572 RepID=UPI002E2F7505|nr:hypothetical protein [Kitasatospora sp. NBC_01266]